METFNLYRDIAERTNGDIYIGVVGPTRTGKSTFVTNFMQSLVIPNIADANARTRAVDELPQSADGLAVMTTQPKFVPNEAVSVSLDETTQANVRLIDCVGYVAEGVAETEDRMVKTPWSSEEMPFRQAAEFGTSKVVNEHSTIAVVVTNDGSIGELPRSNYVSAEERVIEELKQSQKPFIVVLNGKDPSSEATRSLAAALGEKYGVTVLPLDVKNMKKAEAEEVLGSILDEFPLETVRIFLPDWMRTLDVQSHVMSSLLGRVRQTCESVQKMKDCEKLVSMGETEDLQTPVLKKREMGSGSASYEISPKEGLFYQVLSESAGMPIEDDFSLMAFVQQAAKAKMHYDKVKSALEDALQNGYGVVSPSADDLQLEEPQIVRHGTRYGVRLRASAPSLHIMKVDVTTEVSPIVGSMQQSKSMLDKFESDPKGIWETNLFGKSMSDLAKEGLVSKLVAMPKDVQKKLRRAVGRVVNDNRGNIICILL